MNNKACYAVLSAAVFILTAVCIAYLSRYNCFFADDLGYSLYSVRVNILDQIIPSSKYSAFYMHGGGWLCLVLTRFFNVNFPLMHGIHPADFTAVPHGIIKGIFTAVILFLAAKNADLISRSALVRLSAYLFSAAFFLYSDIKNNAYILAVSHSFYRYIFPLLFLFIMLDYFYKIIIKRDKPSFNRVCLVSICAVFLGTSNEFIFYALDIFLLLLIIYNAAAWLCSAALRQKIRFELNKYFYIPFFILFVSEAAFVFSPGSLSVMKMRGLNSISVSAADIKEILSVYFQDYICGMYLFWLCFLLVLGFSIYTAAKTLKIKEFLFPLFLQISFTAVLLLLVLCGRTYYEAGRFWISHMNIKTLYEVLSLIPFFIYIDYNAAYKTAFKRLIGFTLLISSLFLLFGAYRLTEKNYYHKKNGQQSKIRSSLYIAEKTARFFYLSGNTVYLPMQLKQNDGIYYVWMRHFKGGKDENCSNEGFFIRNYYPLVYGKRLPADYIYCFSDDALEKYYNAGGIFSRGELDHINFNRLKDEEFILKNNKNTGNIVSVSEIEQNYLIGQH